MSGNVSTTNKIRSKLSKDTRHLILRPNRHNNNNRWALSIITDFCLLHQQVDTQVRIMHVLYFPHSQFSTRSQCHHIVAMRPAGYSWREYANSLMRGNLDTGTTSDTCIRDVQLMRRHALWLRACRSTDFFSLTENSTA